MEGGTHLRGALDASPAAGPRVVVAVASTGRIHEQTLASIQTMIRATRKAASVEMWWRNAAPVGHCRNLLVDRFLADPTKTHLVFVDTDMVVPERGLDLLLETNQALICGPAPICRPHRDRPAAQRLPYDLTTNVFDAEDPALQDTPIEPECSTVVYSARPPEQLPEGVSSCDATGMSFCLIAREILERMAAPWFCFVDSPDRSTVGEDVYFFRKARRLGYRVAVHSDAWCDHIKPADVTRLETLLGVEAPDTDWHRARCGETPPTMVVACTVNRWLNCRTAEALIRWQEKPSARVGVRLFEANQVGWALARWTHDPASDDCKWERIMLLSPDIVPTNDLLDRLSSVDAPIVSPLSRTVVDGNLSFSFGRHDPVAGRIVHPQELPPSELTQPFPAHTVDLACCVIRRDLCRHAIPALSFAASQADPARVFNERFCELVRSETGCDPVVAPVFVERWADIGLLGMLHLRRSTRREQQTRAVDLVSEPMEPVEPAEPTYQSVR